MKRWKVQDAKARFGELLDSCLKDGPQVVARNVRDVRRFGVRLLNPFEPRR
jgi:hypothetical protein